MRIEDSDRLKYIQKHGATRARARISMIEKELERRKKVLEAIEFAESGKNNTGEKSLNNQTAQDIKNNNEPNVEAQSNGMPAQNISGMAQRNIPNNTDIK